MSVSVLSLKALSFASFKLMSMRQPMGEKRGGLVKTRNMIVHSNERFLIKRKIILKRPMKKTLCFPFNQSISLLEYVEESTHAKKYSA